jgi:hypothetical protein
MAEQKKDQPPAQQAQPGDQAKQAGQPPKPGDPARGVPGTVGAAQQPGSTAWREARGASPGDPPGNMPGYPAAQPESGGLTGHARAPQPEGKRFVILHGRVGGWEEGEVVAENDLGAGNIDRLVRAGAVREAQGDEAQQERVTVAAAATPAQQETFEGRMAEVNRRLEQALQEKSDLQTQYADAQLELARQRERQAPSFATAEVVRQKDEEIRRLKDELAKAQQGKK